MTKAKLTDKYWNTRYLENKTGWDIGYANGIHITYITSECNKNTRILIPGAGNAYEAAVLHTQGYEHVYALDYAPEAKRSFLAKNTSFPENQYITGDFFEHTATYDVILEQTFFCALDPALRKEYVEQVYRLLRTGGRLFGVLFEMHKPDGPPYGGSEEEYRILFGDRFDIVRLEPSTNSIAPRAGSELIIEILKK